MRIRSNQAERLQNDHNRGWFHVLLYCFLKGPRSLQFSVHGLRSLKAEVWFMSFWVLTIAATSYQLPADSRQLSFAFEVWEVCGYAAVTTNSLLHSLQLCSLQSARFGSKLEPEPVVRVAFYCNHQTTKTVYFSVFYCVSFLNKI